MKLIESVTVETVTIGVKWNRNKIKGDNDDFKNLFRDR